MLSGKFVREAAVSRALETNVWKCSVWLTNLGAHWSSCTWQSHHTQLSLFTLKGSIKRVIECGSLMRLYLNVWQFRGSGFTPNSQAWPWSSVVDRSLYCNCILPEPSHVIFLFCLHFLVWGTFVSAFPGVIKGHASKTQWLLLLWFWCTMCWTVIWSQ